MLIDLVVGYARDLLEKNADLVSRLVAARKRFENWLQIELYKGLIRGSPKIQVELERTYPSTQERCDIWAREPDGRESWVELKVCVTNYAQGYTGPSSPRPITNQVSDIIRDIQKLKKISTETSNRHIFLLVYPMPLDHQRHSAWLGHVGRFRAECKSVSEEFTLTVERAGKMAAVVGYKIEI